jgi:hypothetical protein
VGEYVDRDAGGRHADANARHENDHEDVAAVAAVGSAIANASARLWTEKSESVKRDGAVVEGEDASEMEIAAMERVHGSERAETGHAGGVDED